MIDGPRPPSAPTEGATRLSVHRVDPGKSVVVQSLHSGRVPGLFAHWARSRSVYCDPEGCPSGIHKEPKFWKGYLAVRLYNPRSGKWLPTVLEVSEHLELDLRGVLERGQLWEIARLPQTGKKRQPVFGKLLERRAAGSCPPDFCVLPVLVHLYHVSTICLDAENPLPPRVMVEEQEEAPPAKYAPPSRPQERPVKTFAQLREETASKLAMPNGRN